MLSELKAAHSFILNQASEAIDKSFTLGGHDATQSERIRSEYFQGKYDGYIASLEPIRDMINAIERGLLTEAKAVAK